MPRRSILRLLTGALLAVVLAAGCTDPAADAQDASTTSLEATSTTSPPEPVLVAAAGDIASDGSDDSATAQLIGAANPQAVLTLGDNAYSSGSLDEYQAVYEPTWGRFKAITYPAPGNHDYNTRDAAGMRAYFGDRWATDYYSFDLGAWHLVSLNSEIDTSATSPQVAWLHSDLAATVQPCILAYWHSPRFSSGRQHGSDESVGPLWQALAAAHADLVLAGHEHHYERFAKLDPTGQPAPDGIRELVVGTGGKGSRYSFVRTPKPGSERRIGPFVMGIVLLTLRADGYDWRFQPIPGDTGTDTGSDTCNP